MVVFPSLILSSQRWPQWYLLSLMLICSGLATHPSSDGDHFSTLESEPESETCDCFTNKIWHRWCAISRPKLNWPPIASVSSLLEDMLWGHHSPRENSDHPEISTLSEGKAHIWKCSVESRRWSSSYWYLGSWVLRDRNWEETSEKFPSIFY